MMKRIGSLFLVFVWLIFQQKIFAELANVTPVIPGSSLKAYTYTLSNKLKLIVIPDHRNTVATAHFILDAGSDREDYGRTGLAHFFEHMMFRKTDDRPEGHYDRTLSSVGGSGNAGTSDSLVTYYSIFPAPALDTILKLESERFLGLSMKNPYFNIEKGAVISERKLRLENNPVQRGSEVIREAVERDTPLEWMVIGSKNDVENLNIKTAHEFYKKFYAPNNTLLVIGGPFKPEAVKQAVIKYFGKWKGSAPEHNPNYPSHYLTRDIGKSFICSEPITTKNIQFIYPSYDKSLKSVVYSWRFEAILDDTPQGSFAYRLRKKNIANAFMLEKSFYGTQSNPLIAHFVLSDKQSISNLEKFWLANVKRVLNTPLSKRIIQQVIKQHQVYNADVAEKLTSVVSLVTENAFFYKDPAAQVKQLQILNSVNSNDFGRWVKRTFAKNQYYTTGIVPTKQAKPCDAHPFIEKSSRSTH